MSRDQDRLYELLPAIYRQRDAEQGLPLQALLRVIAEQVEVVEDDIARLYDNWFIETCEDWVVPYIGDLIGYRPVHEAGEPGDVKTAAEVQLNKILIPRRDVANTLGDRQRKGTLALLERLARDVAGWPAREVELYRHLSFTQHLNHRRRHRGGTVDVRRGEALARIDGPFAELAHAVDVRRVASSRTPGRSGLAGVELFLWRLRSYSITQAPAYCDEEVAPNCYTASVLGNDTQLFLRPQPESAPTDVAAERNLPVPLGRRAFAARKSEYYGAGRSLQIWIGEPEPAAAPAAMAGQAPAAAAGPSAPPAPVAAPAAAPAAAPGEPNRVVLRPVLESEIVVADLTGWQYQPLKGQVAVDPRLGRIAFPPRQLPPKGVWVSYHYGFSADLGGGEYERPLLQPAGAVVYPVGEQAGQSATIREALQKWAGDQAKPLHAVVEVTDNRVYVEQLAIELQPGETLQLRAARQRRPVLRLLDWQTSLPDSLTVKGGAGSAFTLDGLLVTGRSVQLQGDLAAVTLRHSTLVPGWGLTGDCTPRRPAEPSLELVDLAGRVAIEHCILGAIQVVRNEVATDPLPIRICDSILDATSRERVALGTLGHAVAHVRLTVARSTVFGQVQVHALELGENSLLTGRLLVARRQVGCLRFSSYVPGSRTPRRYGCQPDGAEQAAAAGLAVADAAARELAAERARERVLPRFRSMRYGSPGYGRLADGCAEEIRRGADDESEMGAFHDLYEPQRAANLRARLAEYTPAGLDAGLIFAD
jgi:hypothetical protein